MSANVADYTCPSWCERTDHYVDGDGVFGSEHMHYGPTFGPFWVQAVLGHPFEVVSDVVASDVATPGALRDVAQAAVALAEWLEAQA